MSNICGSFDSGASQSLGICSGAVVIPNGIANAKLTLTGTLDASNTVKTQKSVNNGQTWADVTTYNAAQAAIAIPVVAGEHWKLCIVLQQADKHIDYAFTCEN